MPQECAPRFAMNDRKHLMAFADRFERSLDFSLEPAGKFRRSFAQPLDCLGEIGLCFGRD